MTHQQDTGELATDAEWRELLETLPQIVWITRPDGYHVHFNRRWMDFTGLSLEESLGFGWNPPFHPEDRDHAAELWQESIATGAPYEVEYRLRRADGVYHWMLGRAMPLRDAEGRIVKWFGTCTDIEELKQAQERIDAQARLLDQTQDAILVHDLEHRILYWNQAAERVHGWSTDEAVGRTLPELVCPVVDELDDALAVVLRDGEWAGELVHRHRDGTELRMEGRWTLLRHPDGTPRAVLAVDTDVTERRRTEARLLAELEVKATHDPLTGLPNRALLNVRLREALQRQRGRNGGVIFMLCDLDNFKVVNDALGHLAGDQVLVEVGRRLQDTLREADVVGRLGGDEFAIILEGADPRSVTALTRRLLTRIPAPIVLDDGQPVEVGLSIGVAASTPAHDEQSLLRDADVALYHAKHRGRGRAEHFDERLREDVLDRLALPRELRAGLAREELFCLHQPGIELASGRVFGFESLVRWRHPDRGLLEPARFIPLTEAAGLIGELFHRVLDETLRTQQWWQTRLGFRPAVSVNLSARQLDDPTLVATVASALSRADAPADLLWLEVTETALAHPGARSTLASLHELGVHLAIDDFGTGWSSLTRLSEYPFDLLKIDRSFTARLTEQHKTEHIVGASIVMAHALGMRTVAEGVETEAQLDILRALDCDIAQGFWFAQPLEAPAAVVDVAQDGTWTGPGMGLGTGSGSGSVRSVAAVLAR